jgi:hypothetical protein
MHDPSKQSSPRRRGLVSCHRCLATTPDAAALTSRCKAPSSPAYQTPRIESNHRRRRQTSMRRLQEGSDVGDDTVASPRWTRLSLKEKMLGIRRSQQGKRCSRALPSPRLSPKKTPAPTSGHELPSSPSSIPHLSHRRVPEPHPAADGTGTRDHRI